MLLDLRHQRQPPPWEPRRTPRRLNRRQERILLCLVLANLLALLVGPFAGSSMLNAAAAVWRSLVGGAAG